MKKPYRPIPLPPKSLDSAQFLGLAVAASAELATYSTLLASLPNPNIILSSLQTEEAVLSSRIEGTLATFAEVLMHDAKVKAENDHKRDDIQEINNYRTALAQGREMLDGGYAVNAAFVRGLHKTLMSGARGENKRPGEFRKTQNFIGAPGADIQNAVFIPPVAGQLPMLIGDWLDYLNKDGEETLVQTALMHAQFELLHPFLDGNGRLGRILVPLFLYQKKRISAPVFYVSAYLEQNRGGYYEHLRNISANGDWNGWVRFFLRAVEGQAAANNRKLRQIGELHEEMKGKIQTVTRSQFTHKILDAIFTRPIFSAALFIAESGIPKDSSYKLLKRLEESAVLDVLRPNRKTKIFRFVRLNGIINGNAL